ncbi:MAG: alkaline phosphatase family protein, partial [Candidatus Eisenbacteria bacterium]|nr:alkaline phosphatase family protein [Candidatus Eisenbacteria bacterium]
MEWKLVDPLLDEGKMPNLARIIDQGVRADLRSLEPREKSPTIWTTIATGKGPLKHGIADFLEGTDNEPLYNSLGWLARPVWEILGDSGRSVGVVAWLMSWPALPVNGYNVTDRIVYSPEDGYDPIPNATYPAELADELAPFVVSMASTPDDSIAGFLNGDLWSGSDEANFAWGGVQSVKDIFVTDRTVLRVSKHLLDTREQPDFTALYFIGLDRCCHRFWGPMQPWTVDIITPDDFNETFKDVIPRYYERVDRIIGQVLDSIDDDTTVIVCSDHGFRGPKKTKEGLQLGIEMHSLVGVFAAMGPGIRKGAKPADASVFDITPTILALFGEPIGRDMDGFVIEQAIDEGYLERHPVGYIDTYETGEVRQQPGEPVESPVDDQIKEELRSLGYID